MAQHTLKAGTGKHPRVLQRNARVIRAIDQNAPVTLTLAVAGRAKKQRRKSSAEQQSSVNRG